MPGQLFDDDQTLCFCHGVTYAQVKNAIQNGAKNLNEIQLELLASTGCGGCESDIRTVLEDEIPKNSG